MMGNNSPYSSLVLRRGRDVLGDLSIVASSPDRRLHRDIPHPIIQ